MLGTHGYLRVTRQRALRFKPVLRVPNGGSRSSPLLRCKWPSKLPQFGRQTAQCATHEITPAPKSCRRSRALGLLHAASVPGSRTCLACSSGHAFDCDIQFEPDARGTPTNDFFSGLRPRWLQAQPVLFEAPARSPHWRAPCGNRRPTIRIAMPLLQ